MTTAYPDQILSPNEWAQYIHDNSPDKWRRDLKRNVKTEINIHLNKLKSK